MPTPDVIAQIRDYRPRTAEELHFWIENVLGLNVPASSVCPDHAAPFEYVRQAYFEEFTDAVIWANRGGGKTMLGAVVTLLDVLFKPPVSVRILGGSLEQSRKMFAYLHRLLHPTFADKLAASTAERVGRAVSSRRIRLANGSEVEILAQSQRSVRGNRVQKMRCDEVELFDADVWSSCQLVTESTHAARGAVEGFSTLHRVGGLMQQVVRDAPARGASLFRWCLFEVMQRCPDKHECKTCPLAEWCRGRAKRDDWPNGFLSVDDAVAARKRVSLDVWEAEMLCLRPSRSGAVFPSFDRKLHVKPTGYNPAWPLFRAVDFGYVHPFVCLWCQVDGAGRVHVIREYSRRKLTTAAHGLAIRKLDPGQVRITYCDPAGGQISQTSGTSSRCELRSAGIRTAARWSSIGEGLELIRKHLDPAADGLPALVIDPSCTVLIEAMEAYRYPDPSEVQPGSVSAEVPIKDGIHDHPIDALRYFFVNHRATSRGQVAVRMY